jgi:hypothetical protein
MGKMNCERLFVEYLETVLHFRGEGRQNVNALGGEILNTVTKIRIVIILVILYAALPLNQLRGAHGDVMPL